MEYKVGEVSMSDDLSDDHDRIRYGSRVEGDRRKNVCITLRASVHARLREMADTQGRSASSIVERLIEQADRSAR